MLGDSHATPREGEQSHSGQVSAGGGTRAHAPHRRRGEDLSLENNYVLLAAPLQTCC